MKISCTDPFDRIRGISMRPRTWLLGDEAQNMSYELLKCLINRTEKHSKFVATGDVVQSDIAIKQNSRCGLKMILDGIEYKRHTEDKSMENNIQAVTTKKTNYEQRNENQSKSKRSKAMNSKAKRNAAKQSKGMPSKAKQ